MLLMQVDASMVDPSRSPLRRLTDTEAREVGSVWNPDGKRIAYNSDVDGYWSIWVMDADGGNKRQVSRNDEEAAGLCGALMASRSSTGPSGTETRMYG